MQNAQMYAQSDAQTEAQNNAQINAQNDAQHDTQQIPPCLLCGSYRAQLFRCKAVDQLRVLLNNCVRETPFTWRMVCAQLQVLNADDCIRLCAPCAQWMTRTDQRKSRTLLPMDQFVCACMQLQIDGAVPIMQSRVFARMLTALREEQNYLRHSLPRVVLQMVDGNGLNADSPSTQTMLAWWWLHRQPLLLPHAQLARAVRRIELAYSV